MRAQSGFTLIEVVIAFTILAMGTVLVVNVVTQSSTRAVRLDEYLLAMDTLESAVAAVRGEIANRALLPGYEGEEFHGYRWRADVLGQANTVPEGRQRKLNLYQVRVEVVDSEGRSRLALTTIVADR